MLALAAFAGMMASAQVGTATTGSSGTAMATTAATTAAPILPGFPDVNGFAVAARCGIASNTVTALRSDACVCLQQSSMFGTRLLYSVPGCGGGPGGLNDSIAVQHAVSLTEV